MSIPLPFRQAGLAAAALVGSLPRRRTRLGREHLDRGPVRDRPRTSPRSSTSPPRGSGSRPPPERSSSAKPTGASRRSRRPSGVPLNDIEFHVGRPDRLRGRQRRAGAALDQRRRHLESHSAADRVGHRRARSWTASSTKPLGDVNSVRFAGDNRVWIFAAGSQIITSQPTGMIPRRATRAPGRTPTGTPTARARRTTTRAGSTSSYAEGLADAFFATPGRRLHRRRLLLGGVLHRQQPRLERRRRSRPTPATPAPAAA